MKRLFCVSVLIVIVVAFSSCDDQMKGVMKPVVEEIVGEQPTEPEMPAEMPEMPAETPVEIDYADLPLIESVDLEPGLYRMIVTTANAWIYNDKVNTIYVTATPMPEIEDVRVYVHIHPTVPVPRAPASLVGGEVAIRIYGKEGVNASGTTHTYHGSIMKILKQSERGLIWGEIEDYEHQPTGYEDLPVLRTAFDAGNVQLGQYLMFVGNRKIENSKLLYVFYNTIDPTVRLRVLFDPPPWSVTAENKPIFDSIPRQAMVIDITENLGVKTEVDGRAQIDYHEFQGTLIKNFSKPDIPIEYE